MLNKILRYFGFIKFNGSAGYVIMSREEYEELKQGPPTPIDDPDSLYAAQQEIMRLKERLLDQAAELERILGQ